MIGIDNKAYISSEVKLKAGTPSSEHEDTSVVKKLSKSRIHSRLVNKPVGRKARKEG